MKTLLRIANSPGTIDAGYREEVGIILIIFLRKEYRIKQGSELHSWFYRLCPAECLQADVGEIGSDHGGGFDLWVTKGLVKTDLYVSLRLCIFYFLFWEIYAIKVY